MVGKTLWTLCVWRGRLTFLRWPLSPLQGSVHSRRTLGTGSTRTEAAAQQQTNTVTADQTLALCRRICIILRCQSANALTYCRDSIHNKPQEWLDLLNESHNEILLINESIKLKHIKTKRPKVKSHLCSLSGSFRAEEREDRVEWKPEMCDPLHAKWNKPSMWPF